MKSYKELSNRYLKVQKRRTVLTVIGIILSVALITGVQILYASMLDFWERDAKRGANFHGYFYELDYEKVNKIKNYVGIDSAFMIRDEGVIYTREDKENNIIFEADKDISGSSMTLNLFAIGEDGFKELNFKTVQGNLPKSNDEIVITKWLLSKLNGVKLGDIVELTVKSKSLEAQNNKDERDEQIHKKSYKVAGIIENTSNGSGISGSVFTYLDDSHRGNYSVFINVKKPRNTYKIASNIGKELGLPTSRESLGSNYKFVGNEQLLFVYGGSADKESNLMVVLIIALITAIIVISTIAVIYNAFSMSIIEKSFEYGLLRSVGASPNQIKNLVLREASLMSVFGIPLGIISGFIGIKTLYTVFGVLNYKMIQELSLRIVLKPSIFLVSILVSILTIYVSAMIPALRAARVSPVEALKKVDRNIKITKFKKSWLIRKLFGAEGQIAYKNLRRNRKRFVITVFSLALSVTLYIGFDSFVKQIFYVSKSQELSKYSYVVMAADKEKNKKIFQELKSMDKIDGVYSNSQIRIIAKPQENQLLKENLWWHSDSQKPLYMFNSSLNIMDTGYFELLKDHILKGKVDLRELDEGGVILLQKNINQQNNKAKYMDYTNYQIGDYIEFVDITKVDTREGEWDKGYEKVEENSARVVAILNDFPVYGEYPNEGLVLMTTDRGAEKLNMEFQLPKIHVFKKPKVDGNDIVKYINEARGNKEITYFHNVEKAAEENRQLFITMSIVIYGFITLIILISSVNIFNTISSNLLTRKKELGVIKSIGMSQDSLRKMIYLEGFYYGLYAIIFGGAAGVGLSYLFYKIINMSMNVMWVTRFKSFIAAAMGIMLITTLSTYLPLKKLNSDSIIESIKNEE